MSVGYIYPQWLAAKRKLIEALYRADRDEMPDIVTEFFRNHMFEAGSQVAISREALVLSKDDEGYRRFSREKAILEIANGLDKNGFYISETSGSDAFHEVTQYRILVFGAPKAVGPGTRESAISPLTKPDPREG